MAETNFLYPPIGIAGAARAGKDTLCRGLQRVFKQKGIESQRKSIAGDTIKKDLSNLLKNSFNINSFTEDLEEKELIRPLMVEYGKIARIKTEGRYFIERCDLNTNRVEIIPDIRYVEYPNDEVQWLKKEVNGLLVFVERKGNYDANDTEKVNNKIIKTMADIVIKWDDLKDYPIDSIDSLVDEYAANIINDYYLPFINRTV
jgi:hypothetical protein